MNKENCALNLVDEITALYKFMYSNNTEQQQHTSGPLR